MNWELNLHYSKKAYSDGSIWGKDCVCLIKNHSIAHHLGNVENQLSNCMFVENFSYT